MNEQNNNNLEAHFLPVHVCKPRVQSLHLNTLGHSDLGRIFVNFHSSFRMKGVSSSPTKMMSLDM
jgi:hypothetical protein